LRVGFDSIDFGSFVSPKAIPQMQDTLLCFTIDLSQTKANYWLLLPIPEEPNGFSMLKSNT
jgi:hydroxymethylglutaryl-CoA lyase